MAAVTIEPEKRSPMTISLCLAACYVEQHGPINEAWPDLGSACRLPPSEVRTVRLGQADPLILVMFNRVFGADCFRPLGDQATVGDTGGQRRGEHLRVLHGHFEL